LEYRAAVANGKPTLIFVLKEDASWPRTLMDKDAARIESLREELCRDLVCSFFSGPQELTGLVTAAVHNQLEAQSTSPASATSSSSSTSAHLHGMSLTFSQRLSREHLVLE
jgi:hypothetical protein